MDPTQSELAALHRHARHGDRPFGQVRDGKVESLELGHGMQDGALDSRLRLARHGEVHGLARAGDEAEGTAVCSSSRQLLFRHGSRYHRHRRLQATHAEGADLECVRARPSAQVGQALRLRNMGSLRFELAQLGPLLVLCFACFGPSGGEFQRSKAARAKVNGDEFNICTTLQKTKEQKDRGLRLMRLGSRSFKADAPPTETYKLMRWRPGMAVVYETRIARHRTGYPSSMVGTATSFTQTRPRTYRSGSKRCSTRTWRGGELDKLGVVMRPLRTQADSPTAH